MNKYLFILKIKKGLTDAAPRFIVVFVLYDW